jgi:hypothetical protein
MVCKLMRTDRTKAVVDDRDLYSGLIRLHVSIMPWRPIFGLDMIEALSRRGYRISPGLSTHCSKKEYLSSIHPSIIATANRCASSIVRSQLEGALSAEV